MAPQNPADIEAIRLIKARYFRGIDTPDAALVRSVLAEDCVLDYMGCFTDPKSGRDYFPQLNVVIRGRASWVGGGVSSMGVTSVHQGYHHEIVLTSATSAEGIWAMTDRMFMPPGHEFALIEGFGLYHDTYEKVAGEWLIKTARLQRIRVGGS